MKFIIYDEVDLSEILCNVLHTSVCQTGFLLLKQPTVQIPLYICTRFASYSDQFTQSCIILYNV